MPDRYDDPNEYNWLMREILRHETLQAMALGKLLYRHLRPSYVLDIGCGPGVYLLPFANKGSQVFGIDGASAAGECLRPGEFEQVDLRLPWLHERVALRANHDYLPRLSSFKFSLGLCIEVAEHLKPEFADTLVDTIVNNCNTVYFTGARPGQGGEGHYNEQPREYWLEKFARHGFVIHPLNGAIQGEIEQDEVYDHCHWLRWNGMLLGK